MRPQKISRDFDFKHKCNEHNNDHKYVLGAIFILGGAILIANNLNLIPAYISDALISWQMLLITIGTIIIFTKKKLLNGLILIVIGAIFMMHKFFFFTVLQWKMVWPAAFIFVGIMLILNVISKKSENSNF